ncbi:MAG TPA: hemolysin family protein [Thermomonas sp.]|jgi:putative hemolysin|uniref:hemolysin family protein n=1 Tax=Thermomonas sp. TaxID=1971895 RepID=UPI002C41B7F9|nr:hemolysin family protein [Thermomonas sp.]HPM57050.1 hemolysin family protein [Thermomonas sp.]HPW12592.1 hemolysin family protein [Thermomonas sp.]
MVELLVVLFLILLNAFFALSEMSVVTSRKARLKQRAEDSAGARKALELAEHPERFLSTVQVGITTIGILTGMFGGDAIGAAIGVWIAKHLPAVGKYAGTIGTVLAVGLITYLSIVLGELLPKRLALLAPERLAGIVALPMHWLSRAASPAVWLLSATVSALLRLLRVNRTDSSQVTEEEIHMLVSEGHEQGVIDLDERNMLNRVMRLGDRTADSLMTPRTRIAWLDAAAPLAENLATMQEHEFSRYPVYRGDDSDVAGVLEVKTLLDELGKDQPALFQDLRAPVFVSESTHAMKLLEILREEQLSMALVVDEYGDIQGIVTITDIMDAVLGRLQAGEADGDEALVVERQDGSLLVDGGLHIDELRELTGERLADADEHGYNTTAGLTIAYFGRIPHVGEYFQLGQWRIEVVDLDGPRIDKLLLQRMPDALADAVDA